MKGHIMHTTDAVELAMRALTAITEPEAVDAVESRHLAQHAEQARDLLATWRPLPRCAICAHLIDDPQHMRPVFVIDEETGDMPAAEGFASCPSCLNVVRSGTVNRARENGWTAHTIC